MIHPVVLIAPPLCLRAENRLYSSATGDALATVLGVHMEGGARPGEKSTTMVGSGGRFRLSSRMSPDACISPSPAAQNTRCSPDFASPTEESPTGTRLSYQSGKRVRPAGFERRSHRSPARESTRRCDQPCSNLEETAQVNIEENTAQPAAQECANDTEEHRHEQAATLGTG